jgi:hypothetical protein
MWGASQVIGAYEQLVGLIHGEAVSLEGTDDAGEGDESLDEDTGEAQETIPLAGRNGEVHLRPEVIVPTVTCDDAALSVPAPGTVHLICVDPPYYHNVQYAELSNFFYVWLKRALHDWPGLAHLFREPLAESNREAVANAARWQREADVELSAWQARYGALYHPKAGILYNGDGNIIAFQGSVNETSAAWTRNREKFDVKRSWYSEQDAEDIRCEIDEFETIWHGRDSGLLVLSLPRAVHEHLAAFLPPDGPPVRDPMEIDLAWSAPTLRDRIAAQWWLDAPKRPGGAHLVLAPL